VSRGSVQLRILVVDDEPDNCEFFALLLEREGFAVDTLNDPTVVLERMREVAYHLVVLDMMMPVMDGATLLAAIRAQDSDVAVVVATGHPSVDTAVASLRGQASDYVRKPVEPEAFLAAIRGALQRKGLTQDPEAELHHAIGRTIREARLAQALTLKQLARRTGLSVSLLSQIERAESSASISSLYRIATALRLKMAQLFERAA
jgi:DNA-binding response OmpR family regulator